jgi:LytTr DNA-binding domain
MQKNKRLIFSRIYKFSKSAHIFTFQISKIRFMWRYFFGAENWKWRWRFSLGALIFILFVISLKPLKGDIITYEYDMTYYIVGFFLIVLNFLVFIFIIPKLLPQYFISENWTLKRFFIWFFTFALSISIFSFIFDSYYQNVDDVLNWGFRYYVFYQLPILIFVTVSLLSFFLIYDPLPIKIVDLSDKGMPENVLLGQIKHEKVLLEIREISGRVDLKIFQDELFYLNASDNYVEIFCNHTQNTEGVNRIVIRNTLKDIEKQFSNVPQLFRCHKAYIVNIEKVVAVSGNTKGYFLTLELIAEKIPVSRSNIDALKRCLPSFFE